MEVSVYVDPLRACLPGNPRWPYSESCHLYADTEEELHDFARGLQLRRDWFQRGSTPHYDLTRNKRVAAVRAGAVEHDRWQAVATWQRLRKSPAASTEKGGAR